MVWAKGFGTGEGEMSELSRRGLLGGLIGVVASPAIVRASSLMSIKPLQRFPTWEEMQDIILQPMIDRVVGLIEQDIMEGTNRTGLFDRQFRGFVYVPRS